MALTTQELQALADELERAILSGTDTIQVTAGGESRMQRFQSITAMRVALADAKRQLAGGGRTRSRAQLSRGLTGNGGGGDDGGGFSSL